jgi:hypothetical protein
MRWFIYDKQPQVTSFAESHRNRTEFTRNTVALIAKLDLNSLEDMLKGNNARAHRKGDLVVEHFLFAS